jgi:hypothetical protein
MFTARAALHFATLCIALMTAMSGLAAQEVSALLDSTRLEVGNTTHLRMKFMVPTHQVAPQSSPDELRAMPELDILEQTPFQKTAGGWEQSFQIIAFQAGEYAIPVPVVDWGDSLFRTAPLRLLVVQPALPADGALAPIKDIIETPRKFSDYLLAALMAVALLLPGVVLGRYWRRKKKDTLLPSEPEWPPHIQAGKQLEELRQSQLWLSNRQQFYVRLSDVLRLYIARRYAVPALTETTDIIVQKMRPLCAVDAEVDALREILQTSDLVKFAKAVPDDTTSARLLEAAFLFIEKSAAP